jgi:hypothetical protein
MFKSRAMGLVSVVFVGLLFSLIGGQHSAAAASRLRALRLQPGVGIGSVDLGASRASVRKRFGKIRIASPSDWIVAEAGAAVFVRFAHDRVTLVYSTSANLTLDGLPLRKTAQEISGLKAQGWHVRRCGEATRTGPGAARLTAIAFFANHPEAAVATASSSTLPFFCSSWGGVPS